MKSSLDLAYLIYREGLGPIFSSVYLKPAAHFVRQGYDVRMAIVTAIGEWFRQPQRSRWRDFSKVIESRLPNGFTRLPSPPRRLLWAWNDRRLLRWWLRTHYRGRGGVVLHCGSSELVGHAAEIKRTSMPGLRVIYQVWGPEAAETAFDKGFLDIDQADPETAAFAHRREASQRNAFEHADAVISISRAMTEWAHERYGIDLEKVIEVPCYVDTAPFRAAAARRDDWRRQYGLEGRFVVAYAGSTFRWQLPEGTFDLLRLIRRLRPNMHFVALTTHLDPMRRLLHEHGLDGEGATVLRVPHDEVPSYLATADLSILGRGLMDGPHVVNAISSPVKFGEYLAAGSPVLMSEGIGDFSALLAREGCGVVLPHHATVASAEAPIRTFLDRYAADEPAIRARCTEVAVEHLDIERHLVALDRLYRRLAAA